MAKVLLDVGAHLGETLTVARQPRWGFDEIWCFEPASACWPRLEELADERVHICRFGLSDADRRAVLHDPGSVGASLMPGKAETDRTETVELRDVAAWFTEHLSQDDRVVVKINVEGAECDILDRLLATGEIAKIDHLLVHWDVRKVRGFEHREVETRAALDRAGVPYLTARHDLVGPNVWAKTHNWLASLDAGPLARAWLRWVRRPYWSARARIYRRRHPA